jgi:hypothetical protein
MIGRLMVWHAGIDAWKFDWIRLVFDDNTNIQVRGFEYPPDCRLSEHTAVFFI